MLQLKTKGLEQINKKLQKIQKGIGKAAANSLQQVGGAIKVKSNKNIIESDLINFGKLLESSYVTQPVKQGNNYIVEVGYLEKHAIFQHQGWKSQGMPPQEPIIAWVENKLGVPSPDSKWVALSISFKLMANGHKATPFMEEAIEDIKKQIAPIARKDLEKWLAANFGGR